MSNHEVTVRKHVRLNLFKIHLIQLLWVLPRTRKSLEWSSMALSFIFWRYKHNGTYIFRSISSFTKIYRILSSDRLIIPRVKQQWLKFKSHRILQLCVHVLRQKPKTCVALAMDCLEAISIQLAKTRHIKMWTIIGGINTSK